MKVPSENSFDFPNKGLGYKRSNRNCKFLKKKKERDHRLDFVSFLRIRENERRLKNG